MDYEKKYNEALNWMRELYTGLHGATKEDAEHYFPELAESEDERLRKLLVWQVHRNIEDETNDLKGSVYDGIKGHDPDLEESIEDWKKCLAYLEKQKDLDKMIVVSPEVWDNAISDAFENGKKEGEKQKEQNGEDEECTDFTIYHPLKNGKGKYECIPYSFYGSLTSFSEDKDLIDFLRTCFYTEEECNEWIEQQKEQKPAEWSEEDEKIMQTMIKEGDLKPSEVAWLKSLKNRGNSPKSNTNSPSWSEEDEQYLLVCKNALNKYQRSDHWDANIISKWLENWLKSLRPSWKPSEEQIEALENSTALTEEQGAALYSLIQDLRKL